MDHGVIELIDIIVNGSSVWEPEHVMLYEDHSVSLQFEFNDGSQLEGRGTSDTEKLLIEYSWRPDQEHEEAVVSGELHLQSLLTKIHDPRRGLVLEAYQFADGKERRRAECWAEKAQRLAESGKRLAEREYFVESPPINIQSLESRQAVKLIWNDGIAMLLEYKDDSIAYKFVHPTLEHPESGIMPTDYYSLGYAPDEHQVLLEAA